MAEKALPWEIDDEGRYQGAWSTSDGDAAPQRHGAGRMEWLAPSAFAGDMYTGQWREGKMHGRGRLELASGDWYEGEMMDDLSHGRGTFYWAATKTRYDGAWKLDACHGFGVWTWGDPGEQFPGFHAGDQFAGFCRRRDPLEEGSRVALRNDLPSSTRIEALDAAACRATPSASQSSAEGERAARVDLRAFDALLAARSSGEALAPASLDGARGIVLGRSRRRGWIVRFTSPAPAEQCWIVRAEKETLRLTDVDTAGTATALHGFGWYLSNVRGVGYDGDIALPVNVNGYNNKTVRGKSGKASRGVRSTRSCDDHKMANGEFVARKKSWRRRAKLKKSQTMCQRQVRVEDPCVLPLDSERIRLTICLAPPNMIFDLSAGSAPSP